MAVGVSISKSIERLGGTPHPHAREVANGGGLILKTCLYGRVARAKKAHGALYLRNWRKSVTDPDSWVGKRDFFVFTDGKCIGQLDDMGPYKIIWTAASSTEGDLSPGFSLHILDYQFREDVKLHANSPSDYSSYHGGDINDELAAAISLVCGIRAKSSSCISLQWKDRNWDSNKPYFMPRGFEVPYLAKRRREAILPNVVRNCQIIDPYDIEDLMLLGFINQEQSIAFIRAARLYQEAVWIAEAYPEQSWLLLVSAVEAVSQIAEEGGNKNITYFAERYARLKELSDESNPLIFDEIFREFGGVTGSTAKFVNFMARYAPAPPKGRFETAWHIDWSPDSLKKIFKKIYNYRSLALHEGIPFPSPMCQAPHQIDGGLANSERPIPGVYRDAMADWNSRDTPLLLNTFEYLARHAILNWLKDIARRDMDA